MSKRNDNAKLIRHGWSNYPLVLEAELIDWAGQIECPYCHSIDQYQVVAQIVEPSVRGQRLTECFRMTCCSHRLAVTCFVPEGAINVLP